MADRYPLMSDFYDPIDVAMKVQRLDAAKKQNRLQAMAIREKESAQRKWEKFTSGGGGAPAGLASLMQQQQPPVGAQSPLVPQQQPPMGGSLAGGMAPGQQPAMGAGGPQPGPMMAQGGQLMGQVPLDVAAQGQLQEQHLPMDGASMDSLAEGSPPTDAEQPVPTPEEQEVLARGQKKIAITMPILNDAYKNVETKGKTINKVHVMTKKDSDIQKVFSTAGMTYDGGYNEKTKKAWYTVGKNFSQSELQQLAEKYKNRGGSVLMGLPPGQYEIDFDPITDSVRSFKSGEGVAGVGLPPIASDESLTKTDLARYIALGTSAQKKRAQKIADVESNLRADEYAIKYGGGITELGIGFLAQQYVTTGKMPPMGRSPRIRAQVAEKAAMIAGNAGMSVPQLLAMQSSKRGEAVALTQQLKNRRNMESYISNMGEQNRLLKAHVPSLMRTNSRILNVPLRAYLTKIKGSADEAIFETYLTELSNEIGKLAGGATGSVAELSIGAQERWNKIHDANLPVGEIIKLSNSIAHLGQVRLKSVDKAINNIRKSIASDLVKEKRKIIGKPEKKKIPTGETEGGRKIRRTGTKNGRKVIQYEDGSTEYAK